MAPYGQHSSTPGQNLREICYFLLCYTYPETFLYNPNFLWNSTCTSHIKELEINLKP